MAKLQLKSAPSEKKHAVPHVAVICAAIGTRCRPISNLGFATFSFLLLGLFLNLCGCNAIPDVRKKPTYHNPFPQISRVAILPFRNQSEEPTLSGFRVSQAYYNELQSVPGFEVLPLGVVESQLADFERQVLRRPLATAGDFQSFAQFLGVDAVLQGAVTDYSPYYPPRMTLKVNWYAANTGFHPIPVGYGLPWGTKEEKKIPSWIKLESERALAKEQLATQTPLADQNLHGQHLSRKLPTAAKVDELTEQPNGTKVRVAQEVRLASHEALLEDAEPTGPLPSTNNDEMELTTEGIPADWPDPRGFIPARPSDTRPPIVPQHEPIISHMKAYNGNDEDFTNALQEYFYFRDDARFGGWQSYLQRSEDFMRFCCHLHIVETLGARGGQLESRLNLRWPTYRYER